MEDKLVAGGTKTVTIESNNFEEKWLSSTWDATKTAFSDFEEFGALLRIDYLDADTLEKTYKKFCELETDNGDGSRSEDFYINVDEKYFKVTITVKQVATAS